MHSKKTVDSLQAS